MTKEKIEECSVNQLFSHGSKRRNFEISSQRIFILFFAQINNIIKKINQWSIENFTWHSPLTCSRQIDSLHFRAERSVVQNKRQTTETLIHYIRIIGIGFVVCILVFIFFLNDFWIMNYGMDWTYDAPITWSFRFNSINERTKKRWRWKS